MGTYICVVLVIINIFMLVIHSRKAISFFMICALTAPVARIGSLNLSYDLIMLMPLILWYLGNRGKLETTTYINKRLLVLFLGVLCLSSLYSVAVINAKFNQIDLLGYIRFVLYFYMLSRMVSQIDIRKTLYAIVVINFVVIIIELIMPNSNRFVYELWGKSNANAFNTLYEVKRYPGTFNNVLPASFFMLIMFIFSYYYSSVRTRSKYDMFVCCLSVICGMLNVTKTFLLGFPICFFLMILFINRFHVRSKNKNNTLNRVIALIIVLGAAYLMFGYLSNNNYEFARYINLIVNRDVISTRYGSTGVLNDMFEIFKAHPIFGVGCTVVNGEFVGDSQFVTILHHTGVSGLLVFSFFLVSKLVRSYQLHDVIGVVSLLVTILLGFFGTTFFSISGIILFICSSTYSNIKHENTDL